MQPQDEDGEDRHCFALLPAAEEEVRQILFVQACVRSLLEFTRAVQLHAVSSGEDVDPAIDVREPLLCSSPPSLPHQSLSGL